MKSWHLLVLGPATAMAGTIVPRDEKCVAQPDFKCPIGTNCLPTTHDDSTIICCPAGATCNLIQPIPCDINQQNATIYPDNLIHTTRTDVELEACKTQCCPIGYICKGGMCIMTKANPTTSSSAPSPTVTRPPPAEDTNAAPIPAATPPPSPAKSTSHKTAIAVGVTFGIIAIAILALVGLWLVKRSRRNNAEYESAMREKKSHHKRHSNDDFMGTTPRAFHHHNEAAMSPAGVALGRSQSPKTGKAMTASTVSEPMWSTPPHRTDFLLGRRGSVETGFEGRMRPSWSKRSKNRPKSRLARLRSRGSDTPSEDLPTQHPTQMPAQRPKSRLNPLFATPLRFGLPTTPKPVRRDAVSNAPPVPALPTRPARSDDDEKLARAVELDATTIPSGATVRVGRHQRDRSESQRRPLVRDDSTSRHSKHSHSHSHSHSNSDTSNFTPSPITPPMQTERGRPLAPALPINPTPASAPSAQQQAAITRMASTTSTATFESGSSGLDATLAEQQKHKELGMSLHSSRSVRSARSTRSGARTPRHGPSASSETINVMLPPPSVFQTPPPVSRRVRNDTAVGLAASPGSGGGADRQTTFEELMKQAGWRSSEWKKSGNGGGE